jgi:hypothetical protein
MPFPRSFLLCSLPLTGSIALFSALLLSPAEGAAGEVSFEKQTVTKDFVAEGCAVADFNRDGFADIAAGRYLWLGPDFKQKVAYTPERENPTGPSKTPYNPSNGYSDYFIQFAYDFNGDSWPDILVYGLPGEPAYVFENPRSGGGDWTRHNVFDVADGESPDLVDINGDGKPELLCHTSDPVKDPAKNKGRHGGQFGYAEIDWSNPFGKAKFHAITEKSPENDQKIFKYTHGYGAGDVNGDGRVDILEKDGWYEQPADPTVPGPWKFHPVNFGQGGAQMYVYDVNKDGRSDVITSIKAHGYGLSWFEQNGDGSFSEHVILGKTQEENANGTGFSQIHAIRLADVNGDGLPDIVTGKRRWAHGPTKDDEPMADPVLCWFELKRDSQGGASFVKHLIDADSGVGTQLYTGSVNKDAKPDVVIANKHGVFVFTQK